MGGGGADTLTGGLGRDNLTGGLGDDRFLFNTAAAADNFDKIKDFRHNHDVIELDDAVFGAIGVKLGKSEFYAH